MALTPPNLAPLYQKTDHWFQRATAALLGEVSLPTRLHQLLHRPLSHHPPRRPHPPTGLAGLPPENAIVSNSVHRTHRRNGGRLSTLTTPIFSTMVRSEIDRLVRSLPSSLSSARADDAVACTIPPLSADRWHPDRRSRLAHGACEVQTFIPILRLPPHPRGGRSLGAGGSRLLEALRRPPAQQERNIPALRVLSEP